MDRTLDKAYGSKKDKTDLYLEKPNDVFGKEIDEIKNPT
jgi:hypothetical protein